MKKIYSKEGGQSLVEVTVALALLAVVLTGTVTLAANAVGLMISSRMRTEATAYAQDGMEKKKADRVNVCNGLENGTITVGWLNYSRVTMVENDPNITFPNAKLVTVTVTWSEKGNPTGEVKMQQLMKAN